MEPIGGQRKQTEAGNGVDWRADEEDGDDCWQEALADSGPLSMTSL
jgi:hypothetical protein